ncbi:MAG: hypothetical protein WD176_09895, partial [Pirellulales bacterium]
QGQMSALELPVRIRMASKRKRREPDCVIDDEGPTSPGIFTNWRYLRWYLLMLLPIGASSGTAWVRGLSSFQSVGLAVLGAGAALVVFTMLISGVAKSNWGTFRRHTQPIRYWLDVVLLGAAYLTLSVIGYFI